MNLNVNILPCSVIIFRAVGIGKNDNFVMFWNAIILTHLPIRLYLHRQQHSLHLCSAEEIYPAHCIIISFSLLAILSKQPDMPHQQGPQTPPSSCTVFPGLFTLMYEDLALLTIGKMCLACKYRKCLLFVQEKHSVSHNLFSLLPVLKVSFWI